MHASINERMSIHFIEVLIIFMIYSIRDIAPYSSHFTNWLLQLFFKIVRADIKTTGSPF